MIPQYRELNLLDIQEKTVSNRDVFVFFYWKNGYICI